MLLHHLLDRCWQNRKEVRKTWLSKFHSFYDALKMEINKTYTDPSDILSRMLSIVREYFLIYTHVTRYNVARYKQL